MDNLIDINIIEVNDPGDFLGIEIPSVNKTSAFGIFHQMVQEMNEYCNNDQLFFNDKFQPQLGKEVYAGFRIKDKTWHRVKVEDILQTRRGRQCICYLVDYGQMENIPVNEIRKIPEQFRQVPHQVRRYALYGIQALTLALDAELMAKDTPCVVWDLSAKEYLKDLNKESTKSQVEIKYVNTAGIKYVRLYLNTPSGRICVNDDLVKKKYATVSPVYQLDNKNVNNTDSTPIVPCRNLSETNADISNFIKLISNTSKPQNNAKAQKYLTEVSSSDEVNTVSNDLRRNAVSDSETVTQKLKIEKPKAVVQQSMNKLEELLKCLPSANYKSDHTPDPDMPIPFQRARLPKIALQKAKPTCEAEHSSLPQPSIPKSPVKTVISPVKTTPLEIPSPSIMKKSQVRRLSDTSVVNKTNNGFSDGSSEDVDCMKPLDDEQEKIKTKFLGQSAGKRLLEKLIPPTRKYNSVIAKDMCKSLPELVHGVQKPKPFLDIEELPFAESVKEYIQACNFTSMMTVQAYTWPAILQGRHVVGISPSKTGKTLSYLAPVITQLYHSSIYLPLPEGSGPIVLVLVSSWKKAQTVYETCRLIVQGRKDTHILVLYAGGSEDNQTYNLLNGCKILVATPNCLLRVMEKGYTNLQRLCHLVVDDAEVLTEQFTEQMNVFMEKYALALKENIDLDVPRQMLLFSSQWTPYLEAFAKTYLQAPLIIILSRTEAAVYGKVKQIVHMCRSQQRLAVLSRLLENLHVRGNKIMIFATDQKDIHDIHKLLLSRSMYSIIAHNEMTLDELEEASVAWRDAKTHKQSIIMICSDQCLATLSITDATHVVHFDQPETKTKFGVRLSCLFNYYRNLAENKQQKLVPVSDILVTENSLESARTLSSFLQRSGSVIPPEFKNLMAGLQAGRDDDENIALCPYIKAFGNCSNQLRCLFRHQIIGEKDNSQEKVNTNLPTCGEAKMKVLQVIDANHYYGRLLNVRQSDGSHKDLTAEYLELFLTLLQHFSHAANHKIHRMAKAGDLSALNDQNNQYHRVKILKTFYSQQEMKALVQFYDQGKQKEIACSQLLALPPNLKAYPPQAVEVYLCHVKPMDNDTEWTPKAHSYAEELIHDITVDGRIILSLGNTVWVDPLVHRVHLKSIHSTINKLNIRSELIKNKLATDNPEHARNLIQLFKDTVPVDDSVIKFYLNPNDCENEAETEILPEGLDYHDVYITAVDHPGLFHVQRLETNKELEKMQDKITEKIKQDEITSLVEPPLVGDFCLSPCLADDHEHRWYRSKVIEVTEEGKVKVFFVDYGDLEIVEFTSLKYLPRKYKYLPHQAVECSLADIRPTGDKWSEESGDTLWNLTRYINKDYKKMIAQVCSKTGAERAGRYRYEIKLYDTTSQYDINISQELVWRQQAICDNEQLEDRFPKTNSKAENLHCVKDIPALCSLIYWNQNSTDELNLEKQVDQILSSHISNYRQVELMKLSGAVKALVHLIGYLFNPASLSIILSSITQAILHSSSFCDACGSQEIRIQHQINLCLQQVDEPAIQLIAAECMATLISQKESLREGWENESCITTICDLLEMADSPQIQCYMCTALAALLQDSQRASDIIECQNAVNTASDLLMESTNHNTQEAAIHFLSSLSMWHSAQKKFKREDVLLSVMKFMKTSLCNMCLHHGVMLFQYLSQASRKNKTLLLEKEIFDVLKRLISINIDPKTKILCEELQSSLAVRTPQQDLSQSSTIKHQHQIPQTNGNTDVMPPIKWSQNTYKVIVTVQVHGTTPEDFTIKEETIHFSAKLDNKNYCFDLELFDKIQPSKSQICIIGNCSMLSLRKQEKGKWSRLLRQKSKVACIVVDHDKIVNSSDSEDSDNNFTLVKGKKTSRLPKTGPVQKLRSPFMENDDSESSEDSLILLSDEERFEDDPYNFFEDKNRY